MSLPTWLQALVDKYGMKPETSPHERPDEQKLGEIKKADLELAQSERERWAEAYAKQPPTFDLDLMGINPKFIKWLSASGDDTRDELKTFWAEVAIQTPNISHDHPRGQRARMAMVIQHATEQHGYGQ